MPLTFSDRQFRSLLLAAALTLLPGLALAQSAVSTWPTPSTTANGGNVSGTISVTDQFQKVFAATAASPQTRKGCTIENNGTHNMYVTEGLGASASSLTNSAIIAAGTSYYCTNNGVVLTGEIDITGTANDAFYAASY